MVTGYVIINDVKETVLTDEGNWYTYGDNSVTPVYSRLFPNKKAADEFVHELARTYGSDYNGPNFFVAIPVRQKTSGGPFQLL